MASDNGTDLTFSPGHSLIHVLTKYSDKTKCILVFYDAHSSAYTVSLKGKDIFIPQRLPSHKHYLHWSSFSLLTFMTTLRKLCDWIMHQQKILSWRNTWYGKKKNNSTLKP